MAEAHAQKPAVEKLDTPLANIYIRDDGAGEFEVWIEDFVIIGLAPTRFAALHEAVINLESMRDVLSVRIVKLGRKEREQSDVR